MRKSYLLIILGCLVLGFTACKKDQEDKWSRVEAKIKQLQITNGGLSGGDSYIGVVDEDNHVVTFNNVAAESNIQAVKLSGKYSLGAKLDSASYNFYDPVHPDATQLTHEVIVSNYGDKHVAYQVIINLAAPTANPMLDKLEMCDSEGNIYTASIVEEEKTVSLGMEGKGSALLHAVTTLPKRARYTFTTMSDAGVITEDNAGKLVLSFMGLTTEYTLSFSSGTTPGLDFTKAIVHDFSAATANVPAYNKDNLVRGSDFDGKYVLAVSRDNETVPTPRVYQVSDLLNGNAANATLLSVTGVEGGTHVVSAGRLSQGHIYICNLTTDISTSKLRVYHYASPQADPEVVLDWDGAISDDFSYAGRLGDNISVNLDASGNGYAFFAKQEPGDKVIRFTITGFTKFSEPTVIDLETPSAYYGYVNEVADEPGHYVFTSSYVPMIWLYDKDFTELAACEMITTLTGKQLKHGVDPRIVRFNRGRYMMFTVSNSLNMHWNFGPALYIMDITDGFNTVAAMTRLEEKLEEENEEGKLKYEPEYEYLLTADTETGTQSGAWSAQCNAAEVNGKLVVYAAAPNAGFVLIEFPKAQ